MHQYKHLNFVNSDAIESNRAISNTIILNLLELKNSLETNGKENNEWISKK